VTRASGEEPFMQQMCEYFWNHQFLLLFHLQRPQ